MSTINHPNHYGGDSPYETIKVIEAWGLDLDFCLGNAIKYISRAGKKGDMVEDLEKAVWYLNRKIEQVKKFQKSLTVQSAPSPATGYRPIDPF